jgi:phosphoglycerate dehydrogenase-like enzyme
MAEPVRIAITFKVDDDVVDMIRAVDPRVEIVPFPGVVVRPGMTLTDDELAQARAALADVEIIFGPVALPLELFDAAPNLRWFQALTAGVDQLTEGGLLNRGFTVTKVSGLASSAIAEYALASMLMLAKGLHTMIRNQAEHRWAFRFNAELRGKTVGIVGYGSIGKATAKLAKAFGMRVVACRRRSGDPDPDCDQMRPYTELHGLLAESDFVVLSVPLTEETRGMIGAEELRAMKRTAYLVNVARGPVVDQQALVVALRDGTIAGAGLDVFEPEPLPEDSVFWDMPNVIVTPHISGAVEGYGHRASEFFAANLRRYLAGEPLENVVDPVLTY